VTHIKNMSYSEWFQFRAKIAGKLNEKFNGIGSAYYSADQTGDTMTGCGFAKLSLLLGLASRLWSSSFGSLSLRFGCASLSPCVTCLISGVITCSFSTSFSLVLDLDIYTTHYSGPVDLLITAPLLIEELSCS
jgi:hypothetical protein